MSQTDAGSAQQPKNLRETVSVLTRLAPKQINDEISLTVRQLQTKGVSLGVSVALVVVGLVLLGLMVIALVVAAVAGLATVMPLWLSGLLVAAFFLILAAILAGVGALRAKNQVPELIHVPQTALKRVRHDLGVLQSGTSFDPATLNSPKPKKEKKDSKPEETSDPSVPKPPKPTEAELRRRLERRREHLAQLRDTLGAQTDVKARVGSLVERASTLGGKARDGVDRAQVGLSDAVADRERLRATAERVGPWVVVASAAGAVALFLRRLFRKAK